MAVMKWMQGRPICTPDSAVTKWYFARPFTNLISGAVSVTVSAGVVTITSSLPSESVTGDANVSPGVVTGTFSLPAIAVTGDALIDLAVVTLTSSLPTLRVSVGLVILGSQVRIFMDMGMT